jgi:GMP synthase-like glutamine amidotransferase
MRKQMILFIQNDPEVPPGIYAECLEEMGRELRVVEAFRNIEIPSPCDASAVVVLGGSMGVHDTDEHSFLIKVKDFILTAVNSGKPFLGICLGGQLLADVLGGKVTSGSNGEIGTFSAHLTGDGISDPLFREVPLEFTTFQWHNDSFSIPPGAVRLAHSHLCPNQAFRFGENAYGLQFHPEVNEQIVRAWCNGFDSGGTPPAGIIGTFLEMQNDFRAVSLRMLQNFLQGVRMHK